MEAGAINEIFIEDMAVQCGPLIWRIWPLYHIVSPLLSVVPFTLIYITLFNILIFVAS